VICGGGCDEKCLATVEKAERQVALTLSHAEEDLRSGDRREADAPPSRQAEDQLDHRPASAKVPDDDVGIQKAVSHGPDPHRDVASAPPIRAGSLRFPGQVSRRGPRRSQAPAAAANARI